MTFTRFVVVTGLSGAGKSQALKSFEDLGFVCMDGVPPALLAALVALAEEAHVERLAVALSVRTGGAFGDVVPALERLRMRGIAFDVVFLEADDAAIVRRYSETRRRHPLSSEGTVGEAVACERATLAPQRALATRVWDTSSMTLGELKGRIGTAYAHPSDHALEVRIVAFGFKYGLPPEADHVEDVRFLPNPNYVAELKALDGRDVPVARFLEQLPATQEFLARFLPLLDFLIPQYADEGKSRLTLAIGCTGGRHRSVYIAYRIAEHLRTRTDVAVEVDLRELSASAG